MSAINIPGFPALQCVISSLRDTAHFTDEEGDLTNQLRELRDWICGRAALAAQPGAVGERLLRELLAIRVAGATLYADDGELQDNSVHPFIDFKRDSASEIERKLIERGMANAWKSIGQFAAPTEAKPAQEDDVRVWSQEQSDWYRSTRPDLGAAISAKKGQP